MTDWIFPLKYTLFAIANVGSLIGAVPACHATYKRYHETLRKFYHMSS